MLLGQLANLHGFGSVCPPTRAAREVKTLGAAAPSAINAIMGPNGSGKSTLSYVLSGRDGYEVTDGSATLTGRNCWRWSPSKARAAAGLFLAFQYPVEIPGVGNMTFLRTAVNAQRARGGNLGWRLPETGAEKAKP